jgi:hypothetical protein
MVVIFSLLAWFLWDVGYSVYCESWGHPLTSGEWLWAGSGAVFAVLAMIFEFREGSGDLTTGGRTMRYGIAWLLGVPVSVLVIWYVLSHLL